MIRKTHFRQEKHEVSCPVFAEVRKGNDNLYIKDDGKEKRLFGITLRAYKDAQLPLFFLTLPMVFYNVLWCAKYTGPGDRFPDPTIIWPKGDCRWCYRSYETSDDPHISLRGNLKRWYDDSIFEII